MIFAPLPDYPDARSALPPGDYVSPGLAVVMPDAAFPNMVIGDTRIPQWPWLRRWVAQNWYTDRRNPMAGFASRDEASILYNTARIFQGQPCLEIGCWRGWSAVHLALGSGTLDIIDPIFADPDFAENVRTSCAAAGVLDRITMYEGFSPGAMDELAQSAGKKWSLIFVDGEHEGDAPRLDAEAAIRHTADTAMVLFHDLSSPYVAAGLHAMRDAGWKTRVFNTMQIMGVAWRGDVEPIAHIPDPNVFWTMPRHLDGYEVSGWTQPTIRKDGGWWPNMTLEDRAHAAAMRAQTAEDLFVEVSLGQDPAIRSLQDALAAERARADGTEAARAEDQKWIAALITERDSLRGHAERLEARLKSLSENHDKAVAEGHASRLRTEAAEDALTEAHAELVAQREALQLIGDRQKAAESALTEARAELVAQREALWHIGDRQKRALELVDAAASQTAAVQALAHWLTQKPVLLGLLRRSYQQRVTMLNAQCTAFGVSATVARDAILVICRMRALFGLLRRAQPIAQSLIEASLRGPQPDIRTALEETNSCHA